MYVCMYICIYMYILFYIVAERATQPDELVVSHICILHVCNACVWRDFTNVLVWYDLRTESTGNATQPKSTKSKNSNSSVQIPINPKTQLELVPRNTEKSECFDLVDCGGVEISVETVIQCFVWPRKVQYKGRRNSNIGLVHVCDMTRSYAWHDFFNTCSVTLLYVFMTHTCV